MTGPAKFKQADVTRAARAVQAAGLTIARIRIDPLGAIDIEIAQSGAARRDNSWDDVLDAR